MKSAPITWKVVEQTMAAGFSVVAFNGDAAMYVLETFPTQREAEEAAQSYNKS